MVSHASRMAEIGSWTLPQKGSKARLELDEYIKKHKDDPRRKSVIEEIFSQAQSRINVQHKNGAGFASDRQLREYNLEYNGRVFKASLRDMPGSFNVVEAFNEFTPPSATFELREEKDHLFSFQHFIDWATSQSYEVDISGIRDYLCEGLIYSYASIDKPSDLLFRSENSKEFGFASVSFIRFGDEVSAILVAGQKCDLDAETKKIVTQYESLQPLAHRTHITPDENLPLRAEPLPEDSSLWKTVVLLRFDINNKTVDTRYVYSDCGRSYKGVSDDPTAFFNENGEILDAYKAHQERCKESLKKYSTLFELCKTCLQLPAFFKIHEEDLEIQRHPTEFKEFQKQLKNKKTIEQVNSKLWIAYRNVQALKKPTNRWPEHATFTAPDLKIERSGYWRKLAHDVEGRDKNGRPINGKTWVSQVLSWVEDSTHKPVYSSRTTSLSTGENPGFIYVMRNAAHGADIFKIGLTTRTTDQRSAELSRTTSSPDQFLVVSEWATGDCKVAERLIHDELNEYRINPNREYFRAPLKAIAEVITKVILDLENKEQPNE